MQRRRRRTNFLRPMYRLGWLLIWSLWGISLLFGIPAVMPHDDVVGWGFMTLAVTAVAYLAAPALGLVGDGPAFAKPPVTFTQVCFQNEGDKG